MKKTILLLCAASFLLGIPLAGQEMSPSQMSDDPPILINELFSKGTATNPDFVELYNTLKASFTLQQGRWYITTTPGKEENYYQIPEKLLAGRGYLVLQCDGTGIGLHPNFKLGRKGTVTLYYKDDKGTYRQMDSRTWSSHSDGKSKGLLPDGSEQWKADDTLIPTPGRENSTGEGIFNFDDIIKMPDSFGKLVFGTLLVIVLATIIVLVYRFTYTGKDFSPTFMQAFFLIAVLLGFIMQIIGNSLARAFGMMGAVSIARFRTKVEDARDTSFVLFAIGVGMACGLGHFALAIFMTLATNVVVVVWFLIRRHITAPHSDVLKSLTVEVSSFSDTKPALEQALAANNIDFELVDLEQTDHFLITYNIRFKEKTGTEHLVKTLEETLGDRMLAFRWGVPIKNQGSKIFSS